MHYDEFTKRQFSLEPYLPKAASPPAEEQASEESVEQPPDLSNVPKASDEQVKVDDPSPNDISVMRGTGESINAKNARSSGLPIRGAKVYRTVAQVESSL